MTAHAQLELRGVHRCIVDVHVRQSWWFMRRVEYGVRESWDGSPPFRHYRRTKWVAKWRLMLPGTF